MKYESDRPLPGLPDAPLAMPKQVFLRVSLLSRLRAALSWPFR